MTDFELRLQEALRPVDPPEALSQRLETTFQAFQDAAAEELEQWEIGAMRDPRNWVRPVVAAGVGSAATAALVVLRVRAQHKKGRAGDPLELAGRVVDEVFRALRR